MTEKLFVDTNVLVYAYDRDAGAKQRIAEMILRDLWPQNAGAVSPQILQEFYVTVTRKIRFPLTKGSARRLVERYAAWSVNISPAEILSAFKIEDEANIGFWDALIVASAARARATKILTEDLNAGQIISGILIENPFVGA